MLIQDPKTGDALLDLLIISGVSPTTLRLIDNDVARYVQSLTREEHRLRVKIAKAVRKRL